MMVLFHMLLKYIRKPLGLQVIEWLIYLKSLTKDCSLFSTLHKQLHVNGFLISGVFDVWPNLKVLDGIPIYLDI